MRAGCSTREMYNAAPANRLVQNVARNSHTSFMKFSKVGRGSEMLCEDTQGASATGSHQVL